MQIEELNINIKIHTIIQLYLSIHNNVHKNL